EDGIRDRNVTGVQTCALPISANAADYVVGVPTLILMFAFPVIASKSKRFQRIWPYALTEAQLEGGEEEEQDAFLENKTWSIQDIGWSFAIAFGITAVASYLATLFPESFYSAARILLITTLAVVAAQIGPVKRIKGNMDVGLFVALFFLTTIGYMVNIKDFLGSTLAIAIF